MKVKELIEELKTIEDQDKEILLAIDGEGNRYHPLDAISTGAIEELKYDIESVKLEQLTQELIEYGYTEEDVIEDGISCLVLWP